MKNLKLGFACLVFLTLTACLAAPKEFIRISGPIMEEITFSAIAPSHPEIPYKGGWKLAYSKTVKGQYAIDEYVPENETIGNWTKLFTQQNLRQSERSPTTAKLMMMGLKELMEKRCPGVVWNVIREGDADILYEFHFAGCGGAPAQHEIARILYGKWNIWRIAYAQKRAPMDEQERLKWIDALAEAKIIRE